MICAERKGDALIPLLIKHGGHQLAKGGGLDVALLPQLVQVVPELQSLVPAMYGMDMRLLEAFLLASLAATFLQVVCWMH